MRGIQSASRASGSYKQCDLSYLRECRGSSSGFHTARTVMDHYSRSRRKERWARAGRVAVVEEGIDRRRWTAKGNRAERVSFSGRSLESSRLVGSSGSSESKKAVPECGQTETELRERSA